MKNVDRGGKIQKRDPTLKSDLFIITDKVRTEGGGRDKVSVL